MSEELKQLREALRRVKHEAASLADAQVIALEALTQRPAAQAGEREAPHWKVSVEPVAVSGEDDAHCVRASIGNQAFHIGPDYMDTKQEAEFFAEMFLHAIEVGHRASLPTQPAAQATPEPSRGMIGMGAQALAGELGAALNADLQMKNAIGMLGANTMAWLRKVAAEYLSRPATPEPVGEPTAWRWFNSNGDQVTNWLDFKAAQKANVEAQVAEAGGRIEYAYTRPAPGVPEGWRLRRTHDGIEVHAPNGASVYVKPKALGDRKMPEEVMHAMCCAMLAAAQAKGADK